MAAKATIHTKGLTKDYEGKVVVDHIDLDLRSGEVFGLLGPNGAGKTTTILMLLGLTEPSGGTVQVLGLDPARHLRLTHARGDLLPGLPSGGSGAKPGPVARTVRVPAWRILAGDGTLEPLFG